MDPYPERWDWGEDGPIVEGAFVGCREAPSPHGVKPVIVLEVDGVERTIWCWHWKLLSELQAIRDQRPDGEFFAGERITIKQLGKQWGSSGRWSWDYSVEAPDNPRKSAWDHRPMLVSRRDSRRERPNHSCKYTDRYDDDIAAGVV